MFETKESGELCKLFIQNFRLNELKGYNDISSLTDARWALTHEYITGKRYPLWSLKYATTDENLQKLIDNIVKICVEKDFRNQPYLLTQTLSEMKQRKFELKELLKHDEAFKIGFETFVRSAADANGVQLNDTETAVAIDGLRQHIQGDIGLWSEEEVRIAFVKWRNKVLEERERQRKEEERRRQEGGQKLQAHDKQSEYSADNPEELLQQKSTALNKVRQIQDLHTARAILEMIIDKASNSSIINIINEFDA